MEQRGLARAARAHHGNTSSALYIEVDAVEHVAATEANAKSPAPKRRGLRRRLLLTQVATQLPHSSGHQFGISQVRCRLMMPPVFLEAQTPLLPSWSDMLPLEGSAPSKS